MEDTNKSTARRIGNFIGYACGIVIIACATTVIVTLTIKFVTFIL